MNFDFRRFDAFFDAFQGIGFHAIDTAIEAAFHSVEIVF